MSLFLLGADEIDIAPGAFVVYIGTHGDQGAHRADVILPGAAYPEKSGIYVNTEGRVQMAAAPRSRPAMRARTGRSCARCRTCSATSFPMTRSPQLRQALFKAHPHLQRLDQIAPGEPADIARTGRARRQPTRRRSTAVIDDFYLTNPIARASAVMAECSVIAEGHGALDRGGVDDMAEFWTNYIWPLIVMVAQSVLLLVLLLIVTAYMLYADRKIWAAVQIRRGPNVVGPWGLLQSFADLIKFVVKEPIIPAAPTRACSCSRRSSPAALALSAWAVIPVNAEWVIADLNVGILYIFAISSLDASTA